MSTDSDESEEFYDAEELTPGRKSRSGSRVAEKLESSSPTVTLTDGSSLSSFLGESDEFAAEEKFLEHLKREAEERRKKEDAELQRKVQSLERRRTNKDQDKKLSDLEKRKRKLQKLRQLVAEDGTTQRPQELMSESREDELTGLRDPDDWDSDVISVNSDISLTSSNRSNNSSQPSSGQNTLATGAALAPSISKSGFVPAERLVVDLESAERTITENSATTDDVPRRQLSGPEPDIIQSNKPRPQSMSDISSCQTRPQSLPELPTILIDPPPAPKAPPRRKKKNQEDEEGACGGEVPNEEGTGNIHSPTSTVLNLTKEFECALDMEGATCGKKMVQSRDDASTKAETGDESSTSGSVNLSVNVDGNKMRPRSNSGSRFLTDQEILEQISVLNLDTGEKIPLSLAEDKLPQGVNPITLHILRRTKEYSSDSSLHKACLSDDDDEGTQSGDGSTQTLTRKAHKMKRKGLRMKKILGKKMGKTMTMIKQAAEEALNNESESEEEMLDGKKQFKVRAARGHTGPCDLNNLKPVQDLGAGSGAVWTMKFSPCGRLLATGGQDNVLRVWVLKESLNYFDEMRTKYSESASRISSAYSQDSLNSDSTADYCDASSHTTSGVEEEDYKRAPFVRKPFCIYRGHTADLLDLSWSKNYFILSSSMDKTVRLWHISRRECLCCFQHIDFVTAIAFHPKDDRYFLSGSLDGKLRLWNIPDKKVALWNEVSGQTKLITAANFCQNGKFAVVGTYDGRCILYSTDQLKYYAQIFVRSTRGKNARGRKVTGVEPLPNDDKILVTSNDSRLRLYDLRDLTLTCKYKGCVNNSSQIKASFSSNGRHIICGSEDYSIYVWRTFHESQKFTSVRRDRNGFWEAIRAHNAVVTAACFAPNPSLIIRPKTDKTEPKSRDADTAREADDKSRDTDKKTRDVGSDYLGEVLVSADYTGVIKVFKNRVRPTSTEEKR